MDDIMFNPIPTVIESILLRTFADIKRSILIQGRIDHRCREQHVKFETVIVESPAAGIMGVTLPIFSDSNVRFPVYVKRTCDQRVTVCENNSLLERHACD